MTILWLDTETYSPVPITHGVNAYAEHAEIMIVSWAIDDGPVHVLDRTSPGFSPCSLEGYQELLDALGNPCIIINAHNSYFDRTVLKHAWPDIVAGGPERWRDTMAQALAHGLPGSLGILCDILQLPQDKAKDKDGKSLIQLFCKPRPKNATLDRATRETHPAEWQRFLEYAALDIVSMREVHKRLPTWNYSGFELSLWHRDQIINDRGIAIDLELADAAMDAVDQERKHLAQRVQLLTNDEVQAATQRNALLAHITHAYGVTLPDLQASTLQRRVNDPDLPPALRELFAIRLQASTTSTSKYTALRRSVSSDGRLRGTLQFCGASRTGRWAGRTFQPQNLPRPTLKQDVIDTGVMVLKAGYANMLYDNVMELTSSALRGSLIAAPGNKLVISDLSNIEGRVLAWLAGEEWKLRAFKNYDDGVGSDLYKLAYARAFDTIPKDVTSDQRQIGKVMELGLGYGGGVAAFLTFASAYNMDLDALADAALPQIPTDIKKEALQWYRISKEQDNSHGLSERVFITCDSLKRMWRRAHPEIVAFWYQLADTVGIAVANPEKTFTCKLLKVRRDGAWLRIVLPSGRAVCYPGIRVEDGQISYMGVETYSRKWQRIDTYHGKLAENVTQAVARDILAVNMLNIDDAGYQVVLTVHDEVITEVPDTAGYSHEQLSKLLATNPEWSAGLPLSAAGFETHRYRKD